MIFRIDFDKAYDGVSWSFIQDTLTYFKFDRFRDELCYLYQSLHVVEWRAAPHFSPV